MKISPLQLAYIDQEPAEKEDLPTGPFELVADEGRKGSLLLFVPRNAVSALIDKMTGAYGYSHMAIDCGEIDVPTGKKVMIESTPGMGVHYAFQDEYGKRKFVRIPLREAGVNVDEFCDCIRSRVGEKFDNEEALTAGLLDSPAKQICSDLATICLPKEMQSDIAHSHQAGLLHHLSTVRVYGKHKKTFRLFVSPNGISEYFGAPQGKKLARPGQLSAPKLVSDRMRSRRTRMYAIYGMAALSGLVFAWVVMRLNFRVKKG